MEVNLIETLVLLGILVLIITSYIRWLYSYWERRNVPHLQPNFLMGNIEPPWRVERGIHGTLEDIYKVFKFKGYKYGGMFSSLMPMFVPIDLNLLKHILIKDFDHFVDRGFYYNEKDDPLSAHLVSIEGDKWRNLRTKLTPTFTSGKMKAMFQLMSNCGDGLKNEVDRLWREKLPVDVKEIAGSFTTNVIGVCAFGMNCNCFEDPNNEFRYHSKKMFHGSLTRATKDFIAFTFPKLCKILRVKIIPKDTTNFFLGVMRDIMDYRKSNNIKRNDFVDSLLEINNELRRKEDKLTFEEIAAQAFVFFLAGFETSSSTMAFTFYELAQNQDVQDKLRHEINQVLSRYDGKLTYNAIMEMTYMNQVFDETLRKYPIVATLVRVCTKDYNIPDEKLILKKGTTVMIPLKGIHNDPEYYPNPKKFDPERFAPDKKANRHVCAYMPFGEGPRVCIGMRFGIMQAKVGMAIMLQNYRYRLNSKMTGLKLDNKSPLLSPKDSILLDIENVHK